MIALEGTYRRGLSEAVRAILKGSLKHTFFPAPPELRMEHDRQMEPYQDDWQTANRKRRESEEFRRDDSYGFAPRQTEGSCARVKAIYDDFCAGYAEQKGEEPRQTDPRAVRCHAAGGKPERHAAT
jgi:hypothetical protein